MIIRGGLVFQEDKTFSQKDLFVEKGILVSSKGQVSDKTVINAEGLRVLPGLIDIHSHGAAGHDFCDGDAEGLAEILRYEYSQGITSYCPTSMSLPKERLEELFAHAGAVMNTDAVKRSAGEAGAAKAADIAGFNMEGPFLSPLKKGAHREECLMAPDIDFFRRCNAAAGGRVRLVTVAPECEGAMDLIRELHNEVVVSLGHTDADYDIARKALDAGARHVTHLFNAMAPFSHRAPGLAGAAADCADCMVELIADGVHVHESMVRAAFRLFPDRVVLISDSMRAAGLADGQYDLGGQQVTVRGRCATLEDGTIAGSVTNLYDCMCNAIAFGVPFGDAVAAATVNPARSIGIYDRVGSIAPGKRADLLLVNEGLRLVRVL